MKINHKGVCIANSVPPRPPKVRRDPLKNRRRCGHFV